MSDQATYEARIEADLGPQEFGASEGNLNAGYAAGRALNVITSIVQSVTNIAGEGIGSAAWPLVLAAAQRVLTTALAAMGFPPAITTPAVALLVALLSSLKPAA